MYTELAFYPPGHLFGTLKDFFKPLNVLKRLHQQTAQASLFKDSEFSFSFLVKTSKYHWVLKSLPRCYYLINVGGFSRAGLRTHTVLFFFFCKLHYDCEVVYIKFLRDTLKAIYLHIHICKYIFTNTFLQWMHCTAWERNYFCSTSHRAGISLLFTLTGFDFYLEIPCLLTVFIKWSDLKS